MKKRLRISYIVVGILVFILLSLLLTNKANAVVESELKKIAIADKQSSIVTFEDRLYLNIDYGITQEDIEISEGVSSFLPSVCIRNTENNLETAIIYISDVWDKPYITFTNMSNTVSPGKYYISDVFFTDNNKHYSNYSNAADVLPLDFNVEFYLTDTLDILKNAEISGSNVVHQNGLLSLYIDVGVIPDQISIEVKGESGEGFSYSFPYNPNGYYNLTFSGRDLTEKNYYINSIYFIYGFEPLKASNMIWYGEVPNIGSGLVASFPLNYDLSFVVENPIEEDKPTLTKFEITNNTNSFKWGDTISFNIEFTGYAEFITIGLQHKTVPTSTALICIYTKYEDKTRSITLATEGENSLGSQMSHMVSGDYYVSNIYFNPSKPNYFVNYSVNPKDNQVKLDYLVEFSVNYPEENIPLETSENIFNSISFAESAKLNEKVFVDLDTSIKLSSAKLVFENQTLSESMIVTLKDLNQNPYFIVPLTTKVDTYSLTYLILKDEDGNETQYRNGTDYAGIKGININNSIKITDDIDDSNLLYIENDKMTDEVISRIKGIQSNVKIEINADGNSIIKKGIFEAIQGSNKTLVIVYGNMEWIFNGLDIINPKQIDVMVNIQDIKDNERINELASQGMVIDFASNGELPGKCLIRIKSEELSALNNEISNVYYFNETQNNFNKVAMQIIVSDDGYYEFYINHNSKYVITLGDIDAEYVSDDLSDLKLNSTEMEDSQVNSLEAETNNNRTIENNKGSQKLIYTILIIVVMFLTIVVVIIEIKIKHNKK